MNNMSKLITWFQQEYPFLVEQMKVANHHYTVFDQDDYCQDLDGILDHSLDINPYHQEGDVWTHTAMVCKQAENMPYEVKIAALLHDIGKPDTREVNPKNNHVMFLNHDSVSAFKALSILNRPELNLSKEQKALIFNMIALHTQVFKQTADQLSLTCLNQSELQDKLLLLGKADHEGRFTSKAGDVLEPGSIGYVSRPIKECSKEVIILCGLPGSGKSTYCIDRESFVISRDSLLEANTRGSTYTEKWRNANQKEVDRLLELSFKRAKEYQYDSVIVDMTHMSKKSRRKSLSPFGAEYRKKCVVFLTDLDTLKLRNEQRVGKTIDPRVIDRMMRSFYPPTYEEFDEIEYIC